MLKNISGMSEGISHHSDAGRQRPHLHDAEQLHCVVLPVVEDLVAEHRADGVVAHVVGDSDPAPASGSCFSFNRQLSTVSN